MGEGSHYGPDAPERVLIAADFKDLERSETLVEYDGDELELLATGPSLEPSHRGRWLLTLRESSKTTVTPARGTLPPGFATWLAVPLSQSRENLLTQEHLSLREVIAFSEWPVYRFEGDDPLQPARVTPTEAFALPREYLPTRDVSIRGKPVLTFEQEADPASMALLVHIVPQGDGRDSPSLGETGALVSSLQRYVSWAARAILGGGGRSESPANDVGPDWTRFGIRRGIEGTLLIEAGVPVGDNNKAHSIRSALSGLNWLLPPPTGLHAEPRVVGLGREGFLSLVNVGDVLETFGLSIAVKWRLSKKEGEIFVSPRAAVIGSAAMRDGLQSIEGDARGDSTIVVVRLSPKDAAQVARVVDPRSGGFEKLLHDLSARMQPDGEDVLLTLNPALVERIVRYVRDYGGGGAQNRLYPIYRSLFPLGVSFTALR
jgi:hypothetical protein